MLLTHTHTSATICVLQKDFFSYISITVCGSICTLSSSERIKFTPQNALKPVGEVPLDKKKSHTYSQPKDSVQIIQA